MNRFKRRPAPSPSFDYGWRLGVAIGAATVLLLATWAVLGLAGEVWNVYF